MGGGLQNTLMQPPDVLAVEGQNWKGESVFRETHSPASPLTSVFLREVAHTMHWLTHPVKEPPMSDNRTPHARR
jgi:hypothetical protein